MLTVGINGFGRFGLHLLKYWLDRSDHTNLLIEYINDDTITIKDVYYSLMHDEAVSFSEYKVEIKDSLLLILTPNNTLHKIEYTNSEKRKIPWLGRPEIIFECSGKSTQKVECDLYFQNNTERVLISATSWDSDATLVYGFNHQEYDKLQKVISYGSCTVNAYVPLANYLHNSYGVQDSDVNVVHNIQPYRLKDNQTLVRKFCTLEKSGPNLLPFVNNSNFNVNYTIVPYTGVSMIDFRFGLGADINKDEVIDNLTNAFKDGVLKGLYNIDTEDAGPEIYNCSTYSSVFIKEGIKVVGNNLYLPAYFDNENSVNRYYDMAEYIALQHVKSIEKN